MIKAGCKIGRRALLLIAMGVSTTVAAAEAYVPGTRTFTLSADDWARPRSGETIVGFQALRDMAAIWSAGAAQGSANAASAGRAGAVEQGSANAEGSTIEIRYPGGDEGGLWAGELADWLVALGIPSNRIQLTPGNARADRIDLLIVPSRP